MTSSEEGGIIFLVAPGGTSKTFAHCLLLVKVHKQRKITLAIASSGIAATLLERWTHSTLHAKASTESCEHRQLSVPHQEGNRVGQVSPGVQAHCLVRMHDEPQTSIQSTEQNTEGHLQKQEADEWIDIGVLKRLLTDPICCSRGTLVDEIDTCLNSSHIKGHVLKLGLKINIRGLLQGDQNTWRFSTLLLQMGNGRTPVDP